MEPASNKQLLMHISPDEKDGVPIIRFAIFLKPLFQWRAKHFHQWAEPNEIAFYQSASNFSKFELMCTFLWVSQNFWMVLFTKYPLFWFMLLEENYQGKMQNEMQSKKWMRRKSFALLLILLWFNSKMKLVKSVIIHAGDASLIFMKYNHT